MSRNPVRRASMAAAVFGVPAVGIGLLAHAGLGLCDERMAMDPDMPGMTMSAGAHAVGICPILAWSLLVACALAVFAIVAAVADRRESAACAREIARTITRRRPLRTAASLALLGGLPLVGVALDHGARAMSVAHGAMLLAALVGGAFAGALALRIVASLVLAVAARAIRAIVRALATASRSRLVCGVRRARLHVSRALHVARARGSRAPPFGIVAA